MGQTSECYAYHTARREQLCALLLCALLPAVAERGDQGGLISVCG